MSKKALYIVIFALAGVILYLLFMPTTTPIVEAPTEDTEIPEPNSTVAAPSSTDESVVVEATEPVTIDGLFLSLEEAETEFRKSFYYLLLDDGTEIVRIDLRPLLGYSTIDPISKLGVDRGARVRISGAVIDGTFTISSITPL